MNEKFINNIISYFSEARVTEQFKSVFLEELKNDEGFKEKLKVMLHSDEVVPGDEIMWKKIIQADGTLLSQEIKEKLFRKFEDLLQQILQSTESPNSL